MEISKNYNFTKIICLLVVLILQVKSNVISISLNDIGTDVTNDNYKIESKVLSLTKSGTFKISGSCNECQIAINKQLEITLTISSISIDNSNTGPFVIKKSSTLNLILEGQSTITDNESLDNEESDDFEGAGIKIKTSSSLTIGGSGKLTVNGNPKNGIKGGASSKLTINSGTIVITATKNALACDHLLTINGGTITIISQSDGVKAEPDSDDNDSEGTIEINGGVINVNSKNDAIQAGYKLIINGGTFNIKTFDGANTSGFDKDTMSAKGIKCSTNEHENIENIITITGGTFTLNTRDDAIHSDYNITITGGTFDISTGDDGVHADQYLVLGKLNADNSLINMKIKQSYEGLEGANVYIYSGTYNIIASDDGINSAGDTTGNCANQGGGQMGPGGSRPRNLQQNQCFIFHIFIYGGEIYVNVESDGLDANGDITISGGNLEIWGMPSGGDGDPIDQDGTLTITGGTILAGGSQGMEPIHRSSRTISQNFIYSTDSYQANKELSIKDGDNTIRTFTTPKKINYLFYTSKDTTSNYKFSEGRSSTNSDASKESQNPNPNPNQNSSNLPYIFGIISVILVILALLLLL